MIGREILSPAVWGRTIKQDEHPASFVYLQARPRKIVVHLSAPLRAAHTERAERQGQHLQSIGARAHTHSHACLESALREYLPAQRWSRGHLGQNLALKEPGLLLRAPSALQRKSINTHQNEKQSVHASFG